MLTMGLAPPYDSGDHPAREPEDEYPEALREAMAEARRRHRQLTLPQAVDVVATEFHKRGLRAPRHLFEQAAHGALDPLWPFKHPVRARRQGWHWTWR
jgi:hypothetical protein